MPRLLRLRQLWVPCLAAAAFAGASCTGDIGGGDDEEVPGPPDVEPKDVPASPDVVAGTTTCSALRAGERLLSVSPEGHAWLSVDGEATSVRILDPFDASAMGETIEDVEIASLLEAQAWSASDAAIVSDGALWRLDDLARIQLTPPEGFATPAGLCGDPGTNGVLVSGGKVFERRSDGQWWSWDPGVEGDGAPSAVVRYDGDCQSSENLMWLTAADGTLYRVEPSLYSRPIRFAGLVDAAATSGMLAVLEADRLWIGPESWQPWIFPGAVPTAVSASGGFAWMMSGSQLLRFDGASWVEVTHEATEPVTRVEAHAGGAWLVGESEVCHVATAPLLRVDGVRPFLRSIALDHEVRVKASDAAATVTADVDGAAIDLVLDAETGWLVGTARFDQVGWHVVTLSAAGGSIRRTLPIKRVPEVDRSWQNDIAPIYQANCATAGCHVAGSQDPPDLGSYEAWQARAGAIRTRVVEARNMPPAASVGPDWGDDDVEAISQWLEGGLLP